MIGPVTAHYKLHAYVKAPGVWVAPPFEGWATKGWISEKRPRGTRFAVVQAIPMRMGKLDLKVVYDPDVSTPVELWDFDGVQGSYAPPPQIICTGDNVDAMIMRAIASYAKDT